MFEGLGIPKTHFYCAVHYNRSTGIISLCFLRIPVHHRAHIYQHRRFYGEIFLSSRKSFDVLSLICHYYGTVQLQCTQYSMKNSSYFSPKLAFVASFDKIFFRSSKNEILLLFFPIIPPAQNMFDLAQKEARMGLDRHL